MAARSYGQYCGVVTALELVGDRWALLIVRDLLVGARRYTDLKNGLPRIPTNILSTRLKELQAAGVIRRVPLTHGLVYELTEYGRGLDEVVLALGRWGFRAMGEPLDDDIITPDSMTMAFRTAFQPDAARDLPATVCDAHVGPVSLRLGVDRDELQVIPLGPVSLHLGSPHLAFEAGPRIRELISGELAPTDAIANDVVRLRTGEPRLLDRFARTFHLEPLPAPAA